MARLCGSCLSFDDLGRCRLSRHPELTSYACGNGLTVPKVPAFPLAPPAYEASLLTRVSMRSPFEDYSVIGGNVFRPSSRSQGQAQVST